jgi:tetratricopeptide (TPR) repeat protein
MNMSENYHTHYNRAHANFVLASENYEKREERLIEALKDLNKAIDINPEYTEAYLLRAYVKNSLAHEKGDLYDKNFEVEINEAINDLDKAININPNYTKAYFCRGTLEQDLAIREEELGNYKKAIEIYEKAKIDLKRGNGATFVKVIEDKIIDLRNKLDD